MVHETTNNRVLGTWMTNITEKIAGEAFEYASQGNLSHVFSPSPVHNIMNDGGIFK